MRNYEKTHPWISFRLDLRRFPSELWLLLGEARSKIEHLAGVPLRPQTARELHLVYLAKGIRGTTAIEGNTLTEAQVKKILEGQLKLPPSQAYLQTEVRNIETALKLVWTELEAGDLPITVERIARFNELVLDSLALDEGIVPGCVRNYSVGVMDYRAAPAEDCDHLLSRLVQWLAEIDETLQQELGLGAAIVRAVVAHLYLAWIHPFGDGNGRTARLLEFAILSQAGVPTPACHLLSNHYSQTRDAYYRELSYASKSGGDITKFLVYAAQGLVDGLREQIALVQEQQLDVTWRNFVWEAFKSNHSPSGQRCRDLVLDLSRTNSVVSRRELTEVSPRVAAAYAGKTAKTLSRDLNTLKSMGLIEVIAGAGVRAKTEIILAFLPRRAK